MTPPPPLPSAPAAARRSTPWWLWPHVLSLEAPLVAVLWQAALMHAHGVRLTPLVAPGLALVCWVVYALDRTLDTFGARREGELDVRHAFYFRHRRLLLWAVLPAAILALAWMALFVVPQGLLWQAAGLGLLVVLYLASWSTQGSRTGRDVLIACAGVGAVMLISRLPASAGFRLVLSSMVLVVLVLSFLRQLDVRMGHFLPKEFSAALLFALGCTTSARFFAMPDTLREPMVESLLLAALFACNLHGIAARERRAAGSHSLLVAVAVLFTGVVFWWVHTGALEHVLLAPARVVLAALLLHAVVQRAGRRLSPEAHHVLSDVALVLPLPLAWL